MMMMTSYAIATYVYVHGCDNKRKSILLVIFLQTVCLRDLQSYSLSHTMLVWSELTLGFIFLVCFDMWWYIWFLEQRERTSFNLITVFNLCRHRFSRSHPSSCCSVAEIMSVLFFHTMKYRPEDPRNASNDRFVLSKVTHSDKRGNVWISRRKQLKFLSLLLCTASSVFHLLLLRRLNLWPYPLVSVRVTRPLCCTPCGPRRATWRKTSFSISVRWTPSWRDTRSR